MRAAGVTLLLLSRGEPVSSFPRLPKEEKNMDTLARMNVAQLLNEAELQLNYSLANPAEFVALNAEVSIAGSLLAIAQILNEMNERQKNEIERQEMLKESKERWGI